MVINYILNDAFGLGTNHSDIYRRLLFISVLTCDHTFLSHYAVSGQNLTGLDFSQRRDKIIAALDHEIKHGDIEQIHSRHPALWRSLEDESCMIGISGKTVRPKLHINAAHLQGKTHPESRYTHGTNSPTG